MTTKKQNRNVKSISLKALKTALKMAKTNGGGSGEFHDSEGRSCAIGLIARAMKIDPELLFPMTGVAGFPGAHDLVIENDRAGDVAETKEFQKKALKELVAKAKENGGRITNLEIAD